MHLIRCFTHMQPLGTFIFKPFKIVTPAPYPFLAFRTMTAFSIAIFRDSDVNYNFQSGIRIFNYKYDVCIVTNV